jgi:hypothetical protein
VLGILSGDFFFSYQSQCFVNPGQIPFVGEFWFTTSDCTGTPYIPSFLGQLWIATVSSNTTPTYLVGKCFKANLGTTQTFRPANPVVASSGPFLSAARTANGFPFTGMTCVAGPPSGEAYPVDRVLGDPFADFPPRSSGWSIQP